MTSPEWLKHPTIWRRRDKGWNFILSEFGQVIFQLAHPGLLMITPAISSGRAFSESEIRQELGDKGLRIAVIAREKSLLIEHSANLAVIQH
ncbi:MAG: hypothetical protein NTZ74_04515 [Chloroflexi bacterium]|nr:hypothetical protein [Chloroflexota bacterium]